MHELQENICNKSLHGYLCTYVMDGQCFDALIYFRDLKVYFGRFIIIGSCPVPKISDKPNA